MPKEPKILDLILLHLKDRGFTANGWKSQAETCEDLAWITVNRGLQCPLYISNSGSIVLISNLNRRFEKQLDPFDPEMFDQLDQFIGTLHGGDP